MKTEDDFRRWWRFVHHYLKHIQFEDSNMNFARKATRCSLMGGFLAIIIQSSLNADELLPPPASATEAGKADQAAPRTTAQPNPIKPIHPQKTLSRGKLRAPTVAQQEDPSTPVLNAPSAPAPNLPSTRLDGTMSTRQFDVANVMSGLSSQMPQSDDAARLESPWWRQYAERQIDPQMNAVPAGVHELIQLALQNSAQIRVYAKTPEIRETAVTQAASAFDWSHFLDVNWTKLNEPVGSTLTVGDGSDRFKDESTSTTTGFRRRLLGGGSFELSQRLGYQDTNSTFFIPNDQSTARLVMNYTQPLMRGRGQYYNTSLVLLAQIDVARARDEYCRQLQQHLLEVARGYWTLYLERAKLAQKISLYLKTQTNVDQLTKRQAVDAQRSQLIQATAALESRRSDLIRAQAAVRNAETRLRALINAPHLDSNTEIVPLEHPTLHRVAPNLYEEFEIAVRNRPEVRGALKEIRAACVRMDMAKHEMMPVLNLVTNTYVAGLRGQAQFDRAWKDQFTQGAPSFSAGLEWELPIGRRAAHANLRRRALERTQLGERYRASLELIRAEVEVAVREVNTSYQELAAKNRSRLAAEAEAETMEVRWKSLGGRDNNASLMLEALLQAQTRVLQAEEELARAQLTYSLSLINLRHANGTLLQMNHAGGGQVVHSQPIAQTSVPSHAPLPPQIEMHNTVRADATSQTFGQHTRTAPARRVDTAPTKPQAIARHLAQPIVSQPVDRPRPTRPAPPTTKPRTHGVQPSPAMATQQIQRPKQIDWSEMDALMLGNPAIDSPSGDNQAANIGMAIDNISR